MEALRYLILSLLLGCLAVWGSENLFWTMPPPDLTVPGLLLTVVAYSIAAAVALSAVIWSGVGGLPGAFLGAAIVGYMSEGVIVGTIYRPFPPLFYQVWTPLAWHALVTGGVLFGLGRAGASLGPGRMALVWAGYGLAAAYWAQYWPTERSGLPETGVFALYILGCGLIVPVAHGIMDRMGHLPRPNRWVLGLAPAIALAVWLAVSIAELNPMRLVLPLILWLLLWVMRRLGQRDRPVSLGAAVPVWQHFLFLIAPGLVVVLAPLGWAQDWGTMEANWVVAVATCLGSVWWLGRLVWSALKRQKGG